MAQQKIIVIAFCFLFLNSCTSKLENSWQAKPFINAFEEEQGVALYIAGERLSDNLNNAQVNFSLNQDLISGGFKEVFTFTLNGSSSWGEDNIEIITPNGESFLFDIYDGLLFNIDFESNEVARFIELMNYESLEIKTGSYAFTISTVGFINLYKENFLQATS
jgi:hypothetical protein